MFFRGVLVRFGVVAIILVHWEAFDAADSCVFIQSAPRRLFDRVDRVATPHVSWVLWSAGASTARAFVVRDGIIRVLDFRTGLQVQAQRQPDRIEPMCYLIP